MNERRHGEEIAWIVGQVDDGVISHSNGREVLAEHMATGRSAAEIVEARGFHQISDEATLGPIINSVLTANVTAIGDYRAGKSQALGFLVGQVLKATGGQANAAVVQAALRSRLDDTVDDEAEAQFLRPIR